MMAHKILEKLSSTQSKKQWSWMCM